MIIGICGKSGSGKSTLAKTITKLSNKKAVHLDIDRVGHKVLLLPEVKKELIESFGESIIELDSVNRKKLGEIVFNSRMEMKKLSDITWKYMQLEIDKFIAENSKNIIVLDWLLLPLTKYFEMCDIKILLNISYEIRKQRAIERDNLTEEEFDLREKASIDIRQEVFDYILGEDYDETIRKMVKKL